MAERVYWISFRLADDGAAGVREEALVGVVRKLAATSGPCWQSNPSFLMFRSAYPLGTVASRVAGAIDPSRDTAVVGIVDQRGGWAIGVLEDRDILELVPGMKRAAGAIN
ncbi:hypothetical protein [Sphingomonas sanxanigenens]|uniref:Uncharacterized protein n=1 Tax=Sphingomonas sanxanigenens DSM 19645 = NX02 TaxID=1123269 RepID=W0AAC1_9SPHN|nr:hypothetical protein [Sphingomonas sanxanigenens]AHE53437.1 hypothetical protein NX02_08570 [Sphingomonas sanxanigenens DSM 19645 = NX02]